MSTLSYEMHLSLFTGIHDAVYVGITRHSTDIKMSYLMKYVIKVFALEKCHVYRDVHPHSDRRVSL